MKTNLHDNENIVNGLYLQMSIKVRNFQKGTRTIKAKFLFQMANYL